MIEIREISFSEILPLWNLLWKDRVSPIEETSAMMLPHDFSVRMYTTDIGVPVFLGAFDGDLLVGVNSYHRVYDKIRSRGLYVSDSHRGQRIGELLLRETIMRNEGQVVWSYPKQRAATTYQRAGFDIISDFIYDETESKSNCYVSTNHSSSST